MNIPSPSFLEKRRKLKVTIYGPYGEYEKRINGIAQKLREKYEFIDTFIVKDRPDHRQQQPHEDYNVFSRDKSFHYLRRSDVNMFIFYCGAHNESVVVELMELCHSISWKRICSAIMLDKGCNMAALLDAQITVSHIRVDAFNGKNDHCDDEILRFAFAKCTLFLKVKFDSLG